MTRERGNSLMLYIFFLSSAYVHTTCKYVIFIQKSQNWEQVGTKLLNKELLTRC